VTNEDTKRRRHLHFSTGETLSLFRPLKPRKKSSLPSVASPDCPLTRREGQSLRPPIFQKPFPVWRGFRARQGDQGAIRAGMPLERRRQFRTNFGRVAGRFPDSRSGQILGDFLNPEESLSTTLASRDALQYPLLFDEKIFCLAVFLGDSSHLGCSSSFDGRAERREI